MTCKPKDRYTPQIFNVNVETTAPPAVGTTFVRENHILFEYPTTSPTHSIELYSPELGDTLSRDTQRSFNKTLGLIYSASRNADWPDLKTLELDVIFLSASKITDWLSFLQTSLGKEVRLTDYLSRVWDGIILNPEDRIGNTTMTCGHSLGIRFRGQQVIT